MDSRFSEAFPGSPRTRRRLLGVAIAVTTVGVFAWVVPERRVFDALARVEARSAVLLLLLAFTAVALWSVSLRLALAAGGATPSVRRATALFLATVFLNGVTPFGQAGGDPPSGLLLARSEGIEFERGLASITSVNALNRLATVALGGIGGAWLATRAAVPTAVWMPVAVAVGGVLLVGAVGLFAWRHRDRFVGRIATATASLVVRIAQRVPLVSGPTHESVRRRVFGFVTVLERLEARPRRLGAMVALGAAGQVMVGGSLWFALTAVGARTTLAIALVVITVAKVSGLAPVPGGAVSAEVLLVGLLVGAADVPVSVATAAALLYRATAFWVPTLAGGVATAWVLATSTRS